MVDAGKRMSSEDVSGRDLAAGVASGAAEEIIKAVDSSLSVANVGDLKEIINDTGYLLFDTSLVTGSPKWI